MNNFRVENLFPTPVYTSNIQLSKKLYDSVINYSSYQRVLSDDGDVSSCNSILDVKPFTEIKTEIEQHIETFVRDVLNVSRAVNFYVTTSWIMRHYQGDRADSHSHYNSILSGIYYVKCSPISGALCFHKPRELNNLWYKTLVPDFDQINPYNAEYIPYTPGQGDLVLFPSNMLHSVEPSQDKNERICIPFNVFWRGTFGGIPPSNIDQLRLK